ncbi:hypothetical protein PVK06_002840 [Gossypium arboreum]|uniref:Uncharacterized protein n=1 Tax=Gossypium arboreum TaxID=29729 RepID=A0ABR0R5Z6_GOSAR|nr:hypothetical protein PVK06_002840 [Gossypium arboreum]
MLSSLLSQLLFQPWVALEQVGMCATCVDDVTVAALGVEVGSRPRCGAPMVFHFLFLFYFIVVWARVREVTTADGSWNWNCMCCYLNNDIISYIAAIPTPNPLVGHDALILKRPTNSDFTVKSTYSTLMKDCLHPMENKWKFAWE